LRICSRFAAQPRRAFWRTALARAVTRAQRSRIRCDLLRTPVCLRHKSTERNSVIHTPLVPRGPFSWPDTLQWWKIDTNSLSFLLCGLPRAAIRSRRFIGRVAALRISTSSARSGSHGHRMPKWLPSRNIGPSQVVLFQSVPDHKEGSRKAPGRSVESLLAPLLSLITSNRLRKSLATSCS
jgi:hypothetical protein